MQAYIVLVSQKRLHRHLLNLPLLHPVSLSSLESCTTIGQLAFAFHHTYLEILKTGMRFEHSLVALEQWQTECLQRQATFVPWLMAWKVLFDKMSTTGSTYASKETLLKQRAVLEANWRLVLILVKADYSQGRAAWSAYANEFRVIVNLCSPWATSTPRINQSERRFPFLGPGPSIQYPLLVAMCRSPDEKTRLQAARLLVACRETEEIPPETIACQPSAEIWSWIPQQWLALISQIPLEDASALVLGGLNNDFTRLIQ